jgi:hypothetical protein
MNENTGLEPIEHEIFIYKKIETIPNIKDVCADFEIINIQNTEFLIIENGFFDL